MANRFSGIIFIGPPAAGKGTQARAIGVLPGFYHLEMGGMLRSLDPKSDEGQEVRRYMERGELIPDDKILRIWQKQVHELIEQNVFTPDHDVLLLDGIPRTIQQARKLDEYLTIKCIIHLACDDDAVLEERILGRAASQGRRDDRRKDALKQRLEQYRRETQPLLKHYPDRLRHDVEAVRPAVSVLHDVARILSSL